MNKYLINYLSNLINVVKEPSSWYWIRTPRKITTLISWFPAGETQIIKTVHSAILNNLLQKVSQANSHMNTQSLNWTLLNGQKVIIHTQGVGPLFFAKQTPGLHVYIKVGSALSHANSFIDFIGVSGALAEVKCLYASRLYFYDLGKRFDSRVSSDNWSLLGQF